MGAGRSTEERAPAAGPPAGERRSRLDEIRSNLTPAERLAAAGSLVVLVSLLLPWYGFRFFSGLSQTGLDAFGFGQAALVLTQAAILYLLVRRARGYLPPRPLHVGSLLALGGVWSGLIVAYLMVDRPDAFEELTSTFRYGCFVALGGAAAILVGGLRSRRAELTVEGGDPPPPAPPIG